VSLSVEPHRDDQGGRTVWLECGHGKIEEEVVYRPWWQTDNLRGVDDNTIIRMALAHHAYMCACDCIRSLWRRHFGDVLTTASAEAALWSAYELMNTKGYSIHPRFHAPEWPPARQWVVTPEETLDESDPEGETMTTNRWKVGYRKWGPGFWEGPLVAKWEADGDWMTDEYTPDEADAETIFRRWAKWAKGAFPDGFVPISWFVTCDEPGKFEGMPFQYEEEPARRRNDFLTHYEWPVHSVTGERLNWFSLPVADRFWNEQKANKGGFIQEYTGWKPSILQPYVYLPSLVRATMERLEPPISAT
jgi:hypothetical protein